MGELLLGQSKAGHGCLDWVRVRVRVREVAS